MRWIDPKITPPPQGKKILWFKKGDAFVVQRFGKYYFPLPFKDSEFYFSDEPDLWCDIELPADYSGYLMVKKFEGDKRFYLLDELELEDPESYAGILEMFLEMLK